MDKARLPTDPKEAVGVILKLLPNKRLRDVIERRFGIKGAAMTLDAIGKIYGITRERVRQIEHDALRHLKKPDSMAFLAPIFSGMRGYIESRGGVLARADFLSAIAEKSCQAHAELLLAIQSDIHTASETDEYVDRVYTRKDALTVSEKVLSEVSETIQRDKKLLTLSELRAAMARAYEAHTGLRFSVDALDATIRISKVIAENPYQEYGMVSWPTIKPKSIRDKSFVVLLKHGKPMHFQQVASAIDRSGFHGKKKAHPQTVHNELIKDSERFVLVGRGLYALKDWGYTPGTVRDVIVDILKKENRGLLKEAIVQEVLSRRLVKENTIMLNLQNKNFFKKNQDGTYYLA